MMAKSFYLYARPAAPWRDSVTDFCGAQMPYLHYETDEGRQKMMDAVKDVRNGGSDEPVSPTSSPNTLLLQAYLPGKPRIHPRRTLDQFFYHGLDTSARDRDQVVYRYCESHGKYSLPHSTAVMCRLFGTGINA